MSREMAAVGALAVAASLSFGRRNGKHTRQRHGGEPKSRRRQQKESRRRNRR